jgi:hypothetical protein
MKCLAPISPEHLNSLKRQKQTGPGYHVVSVELRDGHFFEQVVVSEGCIIAVRGYTEIPFEAREIADTKVNHRYWNFRDHRRPKARAASGN